MKDAKGHGSNKHGGDPFGKHRVEPKTAIGIRASGKRITAADLSKMTPRQVRNRIAYVKEDLAVTRQNIRTYGPHPQRSANEAAHLQDLATLRRAGG